jgi:uncharacterized protein DUF6487
MTQNECPDCGSAMEDGFILDNAFGAALQLAWQRGIPEDVKLFGLKQGGVKINVRESAKIAARRCTNCGFLKLYAKATGE